MTPVEVETYIQAAKRHYSDTLAYHNWSHAEAVMQDVDAIAQRAQTRGIILAREALQIAAAWHDSGFHEDHIALGFETKEHYSAHLLDSYLADKPVDSATKHLMGQAILGTIHAHERETLDTLVLHRADVSNIGGDYDEFFRISVALWKENMYLTGKEITWEDFIKGSEGYIRFIANEALVELPRLGEPIGEVGSYDVQALMSAVRLQTERQP